MRKEIKIITIITVITLILSVGQPSVRASDASSSSDLQQKIDQIKAEIASKAASIKTQVNQKIDNRVYAGVVLSSTDTKITLDNDNQQVIITNDYTDFSYEKGLKKSIDKGDYVVGLGDINDKGELVAKKVIKQSPPDELKILWGRIQSSSPSAILVEDLNKDELILKVDKDTDFQFGSDPGSIKDAEVNKGLVVVGEENKDKSIQSRFIYIFKQGFIDLEKLRKEATQGASSSSKTKH